MGSWTIYDKGGRPKHRYSAGYDGDGNIVRQDTLELHEEWMGDNFVILTIHCAEPIDWQIGDYVDYRGERFSIYYDPNVVKKARRGTYAEGFTYDNIKFYSTGHRLHLCAFKDVVLYDNQQTYTSLSKFSFFCASVEDLADRLAANLQRDDSGFVILTPSSTRTAQRNGDTLPTVWNQYYTGNEPTGETDVNIDIEDQYCNEVVKLVYEKFGLSYYIVNNVIVIGGRPMYVNSGDESIFRYGKGLGLYEIERTSDENLEIVTKLFAYGSEQNIPLNYYANTLKSFYATITDETSSIFVTDIPWISEVTLFGRSTSTGMYNAKVAADGTEYNVVVRKAKNGDGDFLCIDRLYSDMPSPSIKKIYLVSGINKNGWPSDHIEASALYPAALSINRLMLPGFPKISLDEWIQEKIIHAEEDKTLWQSLYDKYTFSTDVLNPWIQSKNIDDAGVFEGIVNFDGSSQNEIYPTIENTASNKVFSADDSKVRVFAKYGAFIIVHLFDNAHADITTDSVTHTTVIRHSRKVTVSQDGNVKVKDEFDYLD